MSTYFLNFFNLKDRGKKLDLQTSLNESRHFWLSKKVVLTTF